MNKRKIINDPVYGFIKIRHEVAFDVIEHPFFQRLRRINQLGLTYLVYPGAMHTRFQHSLGATHLMGSVVKELRSKGQSISSEEAQAVILAILLHDIGHGPFSHTLEKAFLPQFSHEDLSLAFMEVLNRTFQSELSLCIEIFKNKYHKKFLHQLVSSQLDMDRLDYLQRDSFFTGVSEGVIGSERIIKMLQVVDDQLVVEAKGIYSIENFLIARRLMYWQVYLHKTVLVAEELLIQIITRANYLISKGIDLFASPVLQFFLQKKELQNKFLTQKFHVNKQEQTGLELFAQLDDAELISAIKTWQGHSDKVLSTLSKMLINRKLPKIEIQESPFKAERIGELKERLCKLYQIKPKDSDYFVFSKSVSNNAYSVKSDKINILERNGKLVDIADASDMLNVAVLSKTVRKYFLCYPKELNL